MTRCTATGALFGADMQIIPGITLQCELEAGHDSGPFPRYAPDDDPRGVRRILMHPTEHRHTLTWGNPSVDELAEVLDPDESFDLEVDIAPEPARRQQERNGRANYDDGQRPDLSLDTGELETIPEANPRCSVCGREVRRDPISTFGYCHLDAGWHNGHAARVA